jgi:hypothetical protein
MVNSLVRMARRSAHRTTAVHAVTARSSTPVKRVTYQQVFPFKNDAAAVCPKAEFSASRSGINLESEMPKEA